jgi:hypothetical protein
MICKKVLFGMLLTSITVTNCCQDDVSQKIAQLKETRLQKAQELSDLGAKIVEKRKLVNSVDQEFCASMQEYSQSLSAERKEALAQAYATWVRSFGKKLDCAIHDKKNVLGVLCEEFIDNEEELIGNNGKGFIIKGMTKGAHIGKFVMLRCYIEVVFLNMLVERYEDILQQLIQIDHELFVLTGRSVFPK